MASIPTAVIAKGPHRGAISYCRLEFRRVSNPRHFFSRTTDPILTQTVTRWVCVVVAVAVSDRDGDVVLLSRRVRTLVGFTERRRPAGACPRHGRGRAVDLDSGTHPGHRQFEARQIAVVETAQSTSNWAYFGLPPVWLVSVVWKASIEGRLVTAAATTVAVGSGRRSERGLVGPPCGGPVGDDNVQGIGRSCQRLRRRLCR